ncbi:hypothetical protein [Priestia aryabhattai]|uniref:hypothetical protein n=1 Tax=Priestia aryabhattai TaxID=412384 RepID=UPI0023AEA3EB|nr:hypothetical protein [Priestia aryabhattai]MDE8674601.1 hypothetical protein [Priestia aryabhattai]
MTNYGYYTESLLVRELERLKEEYTQLDLDDLKVMMKEDILLLEKAMNILCRDKAHNIEQAI